MTPAKIAVGLAPDWADEIINRMFRGDTSREALATALRKAKADGMREAARMVKEAKELFVSDWIDYSALMQEADKIEKGEPNG